MRSPLSFKVNNPAQEAQSLISHAAIFNCHSAIPQQINHLPVILDKQYPYAIMFFEFHAANPPRPPGSSSNSCKIIGPHEVTFSPTVRLRKSFSCNTYGFPRKCCKQKTYRRANSFRCNTYKKQGGGGCMDNPYLSAWKPRSDQRHVAHLSFFSTTCAMPFP